jgi:hypothetical protein
MVEGIQAPPSLQKYDVCGKSLTNSARSVKTSFVEDN